MKLLTSTQSMNLNDIECPWPADGADLSLVELNEVEKTWLAHHVVAKLQATRELAERFNMKPDTLRSYAQYTVESIPCRLVVMDVANWCCNFRNCNDLWPISIFKIFKKAGWFSPWGDFAHHWDSRRAFPQKKSKFCIPIWNSENGPQFFCANTIYVVEIYIRFPFFSFSSTWIRRTWIPCANTLLTHGVIRSFPSNFSARARICLFSVFVICDAINFCPLFVISPALTDFANTDKCRYCWLL